MRDGHNRATAGVLIGDTLSQNATGVQVRRDGGRGEGKAETGSQSSLSLFVGAIAGILR